MFKKAEGISRKEVEEERKEKERKKEERKKIEAKILEFLRGHPDRMYTTKEIAKNLGINYKITLRALVEPTLEGKIEEMRSKKKRETVFGIKQEEEKKGILREEVEKEEREIKTKIQEFLREHPDRMYTSEEVAESLGIDPTAVFTGLLTEEIEIRRDKKGRNVYGIKQS